MNHAINAIAHETKIRRWTTFTPPQNTAHAALCGLVLHRRAYEDSWYRSAISFHEGAGILWQHADSIRGGALVALMNGALSIELLLKPLIATGMT
jgi:hypothetical protein